MDASATSPDGLRDSVVQALGRLPSELPSLEATGELKLALDDLASIRASLSRPDFPLLPKPPATSDSLAPLPLVTMISVPRATATVKDEPKSVEIKMETEAEDTKVVTEDQHGDMEVD